MKQTTHVSPSLSYLITVSSACSWSGLGRPDWSRRSSGCWGQSSGHQKAGLVGHVGLWTTQVSHGSEHGVMCRRKEWAEAGIGRLGTAEGNSAKFVSPAPCSTRTLTHTCVSRRQREEAQLRLLGPGTWTGREERFRVAISRCSPLLEACG